MNFGTTAVRPHHHHGYREAGVWADRTIAESARSLAERQPDTLAFLDEPSRPTYASLLTDAEALVVALDELGLRPGDVLSFQIPNWIEAAVINLAAAVGGFVVNPIVTIYREAEVRQMLEDSGSRVIFVPGQYRGFDFTALAEQLRRQLSQLQHVVTVRSGRSGTDFASLVAAGRGKRLPARRVDPDTVKLLLYTSGTTGRPKGVLHSHNTLERVMRTSFARWAIGPGDAVLMPSPVTHISGYCNGLEQPFVSETQTILMEHWNAGAAIDLIEKYNIVGTVAATPFLKELAEQAKTRAVKLPSLRHFACGGAAVPADLVRDANNEFSRPCAFRVYGSSEVPLVTVGYDAAAHPELAAATDGEIADYEVRFVDDDGRDCPDGEEGEILARGPSMFLGYSDLEQTRETITADGFFRTGDIGMRTLEGAILITGRKKDLIIRGGENISAKEIEDVLHRHPSILEAAVVSMPHERLGEGVCAFLILRGSQPPDLQTIGSFLHQNGLARQKCPERIEIVEDLPRTASGKVRKDVLRADVRDIISRKAAGLNGSAFVVAG